MPPCRYGRADVPPDVTTGLVVAAVGGRVVVGGAVVVVGAAGALPLGVAGARAAGIGAAGTDVCTGAGLATGGVAAVGCGAVVGGAVDDGAPAGTVVGGTVVGGVWALALEPGCSRATVTPMKAATPVETRTIAPVSWRRRSSACPRVCGE